MSIFDKIFKNFKLIFIIFFLVVIIIKILDHASSNKNLLKIDYYTEYAKGLNDGKLTLHTKPPKEYKSLGKKVYDPNEIKKLCSNNFCECDGAFCKNHIHDALYYEDNYYLLYGLAPSILNLIFSKFSGIYLSDTIIGILFLILSLISFYYINKLIFSDNKNILFLIIILIVSPFFLNIFHRLLIYEANIVFNLTLLNFGSIFLILYFKKKLKYFLYISAFFFGLALNTRITASFIFIFCIFIFLFYNFLKETNKVSKIKTFLIPCFILFCFFLLPFILNYIRFESALNFGENYQLVGIPFDSYLNYNLSLFAIKILNYTILPPSLKSNIINYLNLENNNFANDESFLPPVLIYLPLLLFIRKPENNFEKNIFYISITSVVANILFLSFLPGVGERYILDFIFPLLLLLNFIKKNKKILFYLTIIYILFMSLNFSNFFQLYTQRNYEVKNIKFKQNLLYEKKYGFLAIGNKSEKSTLILVQKTKDNINIYCDKWGEEIKLIHVTKNLEKDIILINIKKKEITFNYKNQESNNVCKFHEDYFFFPKLIKGKKFLSEIGFSTYDDLVDVTYK
jgi:hypothetical protein